MMAKNCCVTCIEGHNIDRGETNIKYRRKPIRYTDGCNKSEICYWSSINSMYSITVPLQNDSKKKKQTTNLPHISQYTQRIPPQTRRISNRKLPFGGRCRFIKILKRWPADYLNASPPPPLLCKRNICDNVPITNKKPNKKKGKKGQKKK